MRALWLKGRKYHRLWLNGHFMHSLSPAGTPTGARILENVNLQIPVKILIQKRRFWTVSGNIFSSTHLSSSSQVFEPDPTELRLPLNERVWDFEAIKPNGMEL